MKKYLLPKLLSYLFLCLIIYPSVAFAQWQPDVRLTNDPAVSNVVYGNAWAIKAIGNTLHVTWCDTRNGNYEIYYKRSSDGGISWGTDTRLTNNDSLSGTPAVAISGSVVHIIWADTRDGDAEIYYKRSTDGGISWGPDTRLTNAAGNSIHASISTSGLDVHVVWQDDRDSPGGNQEIYYKRSTNGGVSWQAEQRLTNEPADSWNASVAVHGSIVHVTWNDFRDGINNGNDEIYYKRSTDDGFSWGLDTRLTNDSSLSELPSVSVSGSNVHVIWSDFRDGNYEIYYKRSTNDGISWGPDTRLTNNAGYSNWANVTASGSVVHVAWRDDRDGNAEIYYKRSTDGGSNWGPDTRLTNSAGFSTTPTIAVWGEAVHIVWQDNRDGNYEIYYKRDPTGNGIHTVSGQVTYSDNGQTVINGFVKALYYDSLTGNIITVDSTIIQPDGQYTLGHMPQDSTDIMVYQNDEDNLDFVPTYYVSTIDWRQATKVYASQNLTNINVQAFRINNATNPFNISGECTQNTKLDLTGGLKDAIIYAKIGNEFKHYGISLSNGNYIVTKLPAGSYVLTAYRIGFNPVIQNVTITNGNLPNINFDFGSPIGIEPISTLVPSNFKLYQNYPNPFNPETKIKFDIPKDGNVKIVIYDIMGREVKKIADENVKAGSYSVNWNAADYSSGLYFYELITNDFIETKKLILIK